MAVTCFNCKISFGNSNFTGSAIVGLSSGKGTNNDGGYFYIGSVSSFELIGCYFYDLSMIKLVKLFNSMTKNEIDPVDY